MSAQLAPGTEDGFVHEAAIYGTDEELLGTVVPFLRDGSAAGEPALLATDPRREQLVRGALGDGAGVTFLDSGERYASPLATVQANRELFTSLAEAGAARIRYVGQIPHPSAGASWDDWARYEAAVNHFYAALPVWSICPYDTRDVPAHVLADVERTHHRLAAPGGIHRVNERFQDPAAYLADRFTARPDPLQRTAPAAELTGPTMAAAREAVARVAGRATLSNEDAEGLLLGVSEAVTNAYVHGRPPVTLRAWSARDRVVVTVSDTGPGPADPFAGFVPVGRDPGAGGFGLWVTRQVCGQVDAIRTAEGFTLRLITTAPVIPC